MEAMLEQMKNRRSIRKYKADPVPQEILDQIIEVGLYAPSGMGQQNTIIVQVTDPALRNEIARRNCEIGGWEPGFDPFYGAPAILIVLAEKGWRNWAYDGSLVMGNLMLATHALGLGGIWINRAKEEFEQEEWQQFLADIGVPGQWEGVGHCAVGYIDGPVPEAAPRKDGRVFWVE